VVCALLAFTLGERGQASCQSEPQVIANLAFEISGTTSERALRAFSGLREGMRFDSATALAERLDEVRAALQDERVFKTVKVDDETVAIETVPLSIS
jgi:outer membrane translocation and assembly module TamA